MTLPSLPWGSWVPVKITGTVRSAVAKAANAAVYAIVSVPWITSTARELSRGASERI
nr:hypothetical protein [Gulosibacter massiliensis]